MTKPWHMARVASRRQLPKPRKMHGPVGHEAQVNPPTHKAQFAIDLPCHGCGYHVCSCKPVDLSFRGADDQERCLLTPLHMPTSICICDRCRQCRSDNHAEHVRQHVQLRELMGIRDIAINQVDALKYAVDANVPFPCAFCAKTGVHDCPGGRYTAPVSKSAFSMSSYGPVRVFAGKLDAEVTRGWIVE